MVSNVGCKEHEAIFVATADGLHSIVSLRNGLLALEVAELSIAEVI